MKYEIPLYRTIRKAVTIEAADPGTAIRQATAQDPSFHADTAIEIRDDDKEPQVFEVAATCEGCDKLLFEGDQYRTHPEEGTSLCPACQE